MYAAESANRTQAARFVYNEDIRYKETLPDGSPWGTNWVTYEVTFVAGEPYNRMVAIRGEPLSAEDADDEELPQGGAIPATDAAGRAPPALFRGRGTALQDRHGTGTALPPVTISGRATDAWP